MAEYSVYVGNIGTVHSGQSEREAVLTYNTYVDRSQSNHGRCAGEGVVLLKDNEPIQEYVGTLEDTE